MSSFPATLWRSLSDTLRPTVGPLGRLSSFNFDFKNNNDQFLQMAPVQLERELRYGPIALVASHFLVAVYLTVEAGRSLHRAYQSLGPSQDTRGRVHRRNILITLFGSLAAISLGRAVYGVVDYGILSYQVWARNYDVQIPKRFYGEKGILPTGGNATQIHLLQWLSDVPVYLDALEIVAEKARRLWWGQQLDLGLISWSVFLAIEGRRRNIPLLWCYQLLGQLVSLAFAQNLFFVAMLLTPVPLPIAKKPSSTSPFARLRNRLLPRKSANWTPHVSVFGVILGINFLTVLLVPQYVNTDNFNYLVVASRVLTAAPLFVQYFIPATWGSRYRDIGDVYGTYRKLFKGISFTSFGLYAWISAVALAYNAPDSHHHRHSVFLGGGVEPRSTWERTTSAFGRILEATSDHPVVGTVGADVILAGLSIGLWVSTRAMNLSDILACTIPSLPDRLKDEATPQTPPKTRGEARALMSGANGTGAESEEERTPTRRRSRRRKNSKLDSDDEEAYKPAPSEVAATEEGDVLPNDDDLDWESAAVVWGLTALGGLGLGSAGAYGSEIIAV